MSSKIDYGRLLGLVRYEQESKMGVRQDGKDRSFEVGVRFARVLGLGRIDTTCFLLQEDEGRLVELEKPRPEKERERGAQVRKRSKRRRERREKDRTRCTVVQLSEVRR